MMGNSLRRRHGGSGPREKNLGPWFVIFLGVIAAAGVGWADVNSEYPSEAVRSHRDGIQSGSSNSDSTILQLETPEQTVQDWDVGARLGSRLSARLTAQRPRERAEFQPVAMVPEAGLLLLAPDEEELVFQEDIVGEIESEERLRDKLLVNLRIDLDIITRGIYERRRDEFEGFNAIGLDIRKVITGRKGDIGVLVLQPYFVRRDNIDPERIPGHTDRRGIETDDSSVELHDFYFNLTRWGRGRRNIKIGHFDVPYGLEPYTDTHFTLHQLMPVQNLGMKKDWGVSLNGVLPWFDYEVAILRGSGMEYHSIGNRNYAIAGRIGTPSDRNFVVGLSGFYGKVFSPHGIDHFSAGVSDLTGFGFDSSYQRSLGADFLIKRKRIGLDATWIISQFTLKAEVSVGRDFNQNVFNALAEINWLSKDEKTSAYIQGLHRGIKGDFGWDEDDIGTVGIDRAITEHLSVGARFHHRFSRLGGHDDDNTFMLQFRYLLPII